MKPPFLSSVVLGLTFCIIFLSRANGGEVISDPSETLRKATEEGMAAIYSGPTDARSIAERMLPIIKTYFDFAALTRRAAGPRWKEFTPEQQTRTQALLTELAVRSYCSHFDPVVRSVVNYLPAAQLATDRCEVRTLVTYYGRNYAVNYRAERISASWHFYDVVVEGFSLVANYRSQFDSLYQRGGADHIIRALEQTLSNPTLPK